MKHAHIGSAMPVTEQPKAPPSRLLWKEAYEGIETVRRTQHRKQMHPPKLGGTVIVTASLTAITWKQVVDELIRNVGRKRLQKFGSPGGRQR